MGKYISKVFIEHIIANAVIFFLMTPLVLILQDILAYKIFVSIVLISCYWYFAGKRFYKIGFADAKIKEDNIRSVIIASLVIIVPDALLIIAGVISGNDFYRLLFRYWNIGYMNLMIIFDDPLWLRIIISLLYAPGFMLSYQIGKEKFEKADNLIKINGGKNG